MSEYFQWLPRWYFVGGIWLLLTMLWNHWVLKTGRRTREWCRKPSVVVVNLMTWSRGQTACLGLSCRVTRTSTNLVSLINVSWSVGLVFRFNISSFVFQCTKYLIQYISFFTFNISSFVFKCTKYLIQYIHFLLSQKWQVIGTSAGVITAHYPLSAMTDNWTHGVEYRHSSPPVSCNTCLSCSLH